MAMVSVRVAITALRHNLNPTRIGETTECRVRKLISANYQYYDDPLETHLRVVLRLVLETACLHDRILLRPQSGKRL